MSIDGSLSGSWSSLENPLNILALSSVYGTGGWRSPKEGAINWPPPSQHYGIEGLRVQSPRTSRHYGTEGLQGGINWPPIMPRDAISSSLGSRNMQSQSVLSYCVKENTEYLGFIFVDEAKLMQAQLNLLFFLISFWGQENWWFFLK